MSHYLRLLKSLLDSEDSECPAILEELKREPLDFPKYSACMSNELKKYYIQVAEDFLSYRNARNRQMLKSIIKEIEVFLE